MMNNLPIFINRFTVSINFVAVANRLNSVLFIKEPGSTGKDLKYAKEQASGYNQVI